MQNNVLYNNLINMVGSAQRLEGMRCYYKGKMEKESIECLIASMDNIMATVKKIKSSYVVELKKVEAE